MFRISLLVQRRGMNPHCCKSRTVCSHHHRRRTHKILENTQEWMSARAPIPESMNIG